MTLARWHKHAAVSTKTLAKVMIDVFTFYPLNRNLTVGLPSPQLQHSKRRPVQPQVTCDTPLGNLGRYHDVGWSGPPEAKEMNALSRKSTRSTLWWTRRSTIRRSMHAGRVSPLPKIGPIFKTPTRPRRHLLQCQRRDSGHAVLSPSDACLGRPGSTVSGLGSLPGVGALSQSVRSGDCCFFLPANAQAVSKSAITNRISFHCVLRIVF